jgi:hypothetical protein
MSSSASSGHFATQRKRITFTGDADIDADGANGQNGARAAYMADAYSFIAPPGRMFCSRLNVSRG